MDHETSMQVIEKYELKYMEYVYQIPHYGICHTIRCGRSSLGVKNLNKNAGSCGGVGLPHDVLNVFFDCLFGYLKRICDFLVCPSFREMLHHRLLTIRQ